ncbi:MAG TPA: PA2169 family four-helix-bundle protein [Solimonas sp.]
MSKDITHLKEIVEIARDGETFYRDAESSVGDATLKPIFARMAAAKRELVGALSQKLAANGESTPQSGTFAGSVRKAYTDVAAKLSSKDSQIFVAQLEETEDRLLDQVRKAAEDTTDASIRLTLQAYLPKVKACHDEMRNLKRRMAA